MSESRNQWLDVCRALAISLVLLSHGRFFLVQAFPWTQSFKFGGFLGVEIFFVLSGFLIGGIMLRSASASTTPTSWIPSFWMRRWMRTLPNYFLFIAINVVLSYSIRPTEIPNLLYYATFTQNLAWHHPSFFGEAWSLAVEEIFYLTTPLLISAFMFLGKSPKASMLRTAIIVIAACTASRIFVIYSINPTFDEGIRKIAALRLDSIMYGVLGAVWINGKSISKTTGKALAIAGMAALCAVSYVMSLPDGTLNSSYPIKVSIFTITSVATLLLIISCLGAKITQQISNITSRISKWSYSAYLANLPVLLTIIYIHPNRGGAITGILLFITYIASTLAISAIIYKTFESKVLRVRDKIFSKEPIELETKADTHSFHKKLKT